MAVDVATLTPTEQIEVLEEALDLIAEPMCWKQATWKCPLFEPDHGGPLKDKDGNRMYGYCLEGAINQATVNLYGVERAVKLGAWDTVSESISVEDGITPTHTISLDTLVEQLYPEFEADRPNAPEEFKAMRWQDHKDRTHAEVIGLVHKKLRELKSSV